MDLTKKTQKVGLKI